MLRTRSRSFVSLGVMTSLAVGGAAWAQDLGPGATRFDRSLFEQRWHASGSPRQSFVESTLAGGPIDLAVAPIYLPSIPSPAGSAAASSSPEGRDGVPIAEHRMRMSRPRYEGESLTPSVSEVPSSVSVSPESVLRRVRPRSGPDPLELSRVVLPLVVPEMPNLVTDLRPMSGAVVGVRPSYVRPASYR